MDKHKGSNPVQADHVYWILATRYADGRIASYAKFSNTMALFNRNLERGR